MHVQVHASFAYDKCSGLDVFLYDTSIGFLLSMVLRLKEPSLINI
jgi:hypothetical protein